MAARQVAVDVVSPAQDVIAEASLTPGLGSPRLQYRLFMIGRLAVYRREADGCNCEPPQSRRD